MTREDDLAGHLSLRPHPEGGSFAEVFRSVQTVAAGSRERSALTAIYFLLRAGEISRWHRVRSDEVWTYAEGDPLRLHIIDLRNAMRRTETLGRLVDGHAPVAIVPADCWQAAETMGTYTLVNCFVAPGFDFEDFALAGEEARAAIARIAPELARFAQTT